jgi:DNA-binding response OmpR family regulator
VRGMNCTRASGETILVVEDHSADCSLLSDLLQRCGYLVRRAETGGEAQATLERARPDLVLLNLPLPDIDGLFLCTTLKVLANRPVILCGPATEHRDRILGLKLGADDYIAKPFDLEEFKARVEAALRRAVQSRQAESVWRPGKIHIGALEIDQARQSVSLGGVPLHLTFTEYRLLFALATCPEEFHTREELGQLLWGCQDADVYRTLNVHLHRLRLKLSSGPVPGPPIIAERGFGYKLGAEPRGAATPAR